MLSFQQAHRHHDLTCVLRHFLKGLNSNVRHRDLRQSRTNKRKSRWHCEQLFHPSVNRTRRMTASRSTWSRGGSAETLFSNCMATGVRVGDPLPCVVRDVFLELSIEEAAWFSHALLLFTDLVIFTLISLGPASPCWWPQMGTSQGTPHQHKAASKILIIYATIEFRSGCGRN